MADKRLDAAIAVTRFGLGARPGDIDAVAADPRAFLVGQIHREGADAPAGAWPDARDRYAALRQYREAVQKVRLDGREAPAVATPAAMMTASSGSPAAMQAMAPSGAGAGAASAMAAGSPMADATAMNRKGQPVSDVMMRRRALAQPLNQATAAEIAARFQLAVATPASFRERWTLFWSNHFTVAAKSEEVSVLTPVFEREAIRPHVFGRFADLLFASTTHPGMMAYLDQTRSVGPNSSLVQRAVFRNPRAAQGLNENLAREVMELHSVGADAGYTQADVTEFARALTGLSIGNGQAQDAELGRVVFRDGFHEPGARTVMGRSYRQDGVHQARAIVEDLATNPHTARRLARKLAVHFVSDTPDPALVARLEASYLKTGGDLGLLALALVDAPEAWAPDPRKFKTPYEFLVSSWRASGQAPPDAPQQLIQPLTLMGQRPFAAPQPNGWSDQAADWASPDAMVKRLTWSRSFAAGHAPPALAPTEVAEAALGPRLQPATAKAIARAETRPEAFAILLMSPEFQRR